MGGNASSRLRETSLPVPGYRQPNLTGCGPTCLRKVYAYYGEKLSYDDVSKDLERNDDGGTLAALLALDALDRGYGARVYSYNLRVFDPTWAKLDREALADRLRRRRHAVTSLKLRRVISAYERFLAAGGEIVLEDLSPRLLQRILDRGHPIITGLSATYLYWEARERQEDMTPDDVAGDPTGHFVVVSGYRRGGRELAVQDPLEGRGAARWQPSERLLHAILLGVLTYDAVLLEVWK